MNLDLAVGSLVIWDLDLELLRFRGPDDHQRVRALSRGVLRHGDRAAREAALETSGRDLAVSLEVWKVALVPKRRMDSGDGPHRRDGGAGTAFR